MPYNIMDFGAVCKQAKNNHQAIQLAIDTAYNNGGGIVIIPAGQFMTSTIFVPANITLEIQTGATLAAWPHISDYPELKWGHNKDRQPYHLIVIDQAVNVKICGHGTIDGRDKQFWYPRTGPQARPGNYKWYKSRPKRISPLIEITNSKNITLENITLLNSPGWTCHLFCCQSVMVNHLRIFNNLFGPNTDGIDINGCYDVQIMSCHIQTGDDAIVIKTSLDSRSCERIMVSNCSLQTNCVALKLGASESFFPVKDVTFNNCIAAKCNRIIGLYSLNGAVFENINFHNICGDTDNGMILNLPIHFDLRQAQERNCSGKIKNVTITNFNVRSKGRILLTAQEGTSLENIVLRDIQISYYGLEDAENLINSLESGIGTYSNTNLEARKANAMIIAENVTYLLIDNFLFNCERQADYADYSILWGRKVTQAVCKLPLIAKQADHFNLQTLTECDLKIEK